MDRKIKELIETVKFFDTEIKEQLKIIHDNLVSLDKKIEASQRINAYADKNEDMLIELKSMCNTTYLDVDLELAQMEYALLREGSDEFIRCYNSNSYLN